MANLVKGPFDLKWGSNTLVDVSEIALDFNQDSNDYATVDNRNYTVDSAITASVSLTFLASDVPALAAVLPQYHVPNGGQMSSGETVTDTDGAIDVVAASCDSDPVYNDLDVISCGVNGQVFRLKNTRTKIDSMEFADNAVRTVTVLFVGEPDAGVANIQFFREGGISVVS
jgi:hypothetical protein